VIGSDVLEPMGHELVPLRGEDEAKEFLRDHQGKRVARFDEVHQTLLEKIDQGNFE
jgi:copper chaperone NosL